MSIWRPFDTEEAEKPLWISAAYEDMKPHWSGAAYEDDNNNMKPLWPSALDKSKKPFWSCAVAKLEKLVASIPQTSTTSSSDQESTWYCNSPQPSSEVARFKVSSNSAFHQPSRSQDAVLPEYHASSDPDASYSAFRETMLEAVRLRNGGSLTVSNPNMRRSFPSKVGDGRRARNAAVAKRSRDAKRLRREELAIRAQYLEKMNAGLRVRIAAVKMAKISERCHTCWSPYCS